MKPEPMKDKGRWANEDLCLEYSQEAINSKYKEHCVSLWFRQEDIKSAVEWLKKELKLHYWCEEEKQYIIPFDSLPDVINEAFEDVSKK